MQALRPACRSLQTFSWHNCAVRCANISNWSSSVVGERRHSDVGLLPIRDGITLDFPLSGGCAFRDYGHIQASRMSTLAEAGAVPAEVKSGSRKLEVSRDDLLNLMKQGALHLYDVREPNEVEESGRIPGALNIPLTSLKASLTMDAEKFKEAFKSEMPTKDSQNIVFYGFSTVKSATALEIAHKLGFKKARHYPGGWEEWSRFEKKP